MLEIANLAEVIKGLDKFEKDVAATALTAYRGLCNYVFAYVVEETPQYTGESVSNWRMSSGSPEYSTDSGIKSARSRKGRRLKGLAIYQKQGFTGAGSVFDSASGTGGNPAAMKIARASLRAGTRKISLEQPVFISNATEWHSDFNIWALEMPPGGFLRNVNAPGAMMGRAVSYVVDNFALIGPNNIKRLMVTPV